MRCKLIGILLCVCIIFLINTAECYKSEIEITPAPPEEVTTKKSGFFSGFKNFFRGSSSTTTQVPPVVEVTTPKSIAQNLPQGGRDKPPPLSINASPAPLVPLGPRPDTPPSSPVAGNQQQPPQWPQPQPQSPNQPQDKRPTPQNTPTNTQIGTRPNTGQPNLPPGFRPYQPSKPLPSGLDLSYGGTRPQQNVGRPGFGLAPMTSSTTSTTTARPVQSPQPTGNFDLRGNMFTDSSTSTTTKKPTTAKEDFPALPAPRRPSIKEDFPALPSPNSRPGSPTPAPLPGSPTGPRPSSPSAWSTTPATINKLPPVTPTPRVSFVPHTGSSTTAKPGPNNPVDDEIRALTEALYTKEVSNQLNLIKLNPQGKTRSIDSTDVAPQPLLEVDEKALESPTIAKMRLLFNNYETDTMVNEHVSANEHKEENDFVDAVMATAVMRHAMQFLQNKGYVTPDPKTHRDLIKELWFTQYSRGNGKVGSSGFEHVFVNEVKNGTIIGLHNWVYFYEEEKAGRLDYKGYINQLDMGTKGKVVKARFTHNGLNKPVNTLFIGTSPELELALYTVCFKLKQDRTCPVSLGNSKFGIVTYAWRYRGKNLIGSAYPEI